MSEACTGPRGGRNLRRTGEYGQQTAEIVAWRRRDLGLSLVEVSERLAEVGCSIASNIIGRIERGERRIHMDDLMALAAALELKPAEMLPLAPVQE